MKNLILVTGAARSGKSQFAEKLASVKDAPVLYLATMARDADDHEQEQRIARHQERRPSTWTTIERPYNLSQTVASIPPRVELCIIDCLSVYISNLLIAAAAGDVDADPYKQEAAVTAEVEAILAAMEAQPKVRFLVVTNEVGWGIVPGNALARAFRDFLGLANQRFASQAEEVWLTCVGLPLRLKPQASLPH